MHMKLVIAGGFVLLGLFLLFGHLWGGTRPDLGLAAKLFLPFWLLVSIANMWVGVARAGYSARKELPILLIVYIIPSALAWLAISRLAQ